WKLVHNRAGEYFYTATCGYHFVKDGENYSSVYPNFVIGVNDKTNRAALGGRYQSSFIERNWDPNYFSLRTLTHMTDCRGGAAARTCNGDHATPRPRPVGGSVRARRRLRRRGARAPRQVGVGIRLEVLQRGRPAPEHERPPAPLGEAPNRGARRAREIRGVDRDVQRERRDPRRARPQAGG